jgi:hypothetical protein
MRFEIIRDGEFYPKLRVSGFRAGDAIIRQKEALYSHEGKWEKFEPIMPGERFNPNASELAKFMAGFRIGAVTHSFGDKPLLLERPKEASSVLLLEMDHIGEIVEIHLNDPMGKETNERLGKVFVRLGGFFAASWASVNFGLEPIKNVQTGNALSNAFGIKDGYQNSLQSFTPRFIGKPTSGILFLESIGRCRRILIRKGEVYPGLAPDKVFAMSYNVEVILHGNSTFPGGEADGGWYDATYRVKNEYPGKYGVIWIDDGRKRVAK